MTIDAGNDYRVVDQIWTLRLKALSVESLSSDNSIEYEFNVTFLDGCLIDSLTA